MIGRAFGVALVLVLALWRPAATTVVEERNCGLYGKCAGATPRRLLDPAAMDNTTFDKSLCFCDDECSLLKDCCRDATPLPTQLVLGIEPRYWSCGKQRLENRVHEMLYMVSSCPEGHHLQSLCTKDVPEYDYKLDLPVLSTSTGTWFQNIFCAVCHDHGHSLQPMTLSFSCTGLNATVDSVLGNGKYVPGTLTWNRTECFCALKPELARVNGSAAAPWERPCIEAVHQCPGDWEDQSVADRCRSYTLYMSTRDRSQVFKNSYCALCHGLAADDVMCRRGGFIGRRPSSTASQPSLRLIMDFSWDVVREGCLPPAGVWDALHGRCQALTVACAPGSHLQSGRCLPDLSFRSADPYFDNSSSSSSFNDTCSRTVLDPGEFTLLDNGSLQLTIIHSDFTGLLFPPGQYGTFEDGTAEVCDIFQTSLINLDTVQGYLTTVCLSISAICLVLHLLIHALLPKLHNLPGKNLQALSWALLVAQLGFLLGVTPVFRVPHHACVAIAALLHFSYLAAFCWMNVMSVDIWRTFSASTARTGGSLSTHHRYSLYAWGVPVLVTGLALVANYTDMLPIPMRPNFAVAGACWFGNRVGLGLFLAAPVTAILVVNISLFCSTVYKLYEKQESRRYIEKKTQVELAQATQRHAGAVTLARPTVSGPTVSGPRDQIRFYLYVKLFTIMGLSWVTGTVAVLAHQPALWYPYVILNGLQGAFIFIMFDVKRSVLVMLWERLLGRRPLPKLLAPTTTTRNSSTGGGDSSRTRVTSSSRLSSSATSDHVRLPLMSDSTESPVRRLSCRQRSLAQEAMEETALQQNHAWNNSTDTNKVNNVHSAFEIT